MTNENTQVLLQTLRALIEAIESGGKTEAPSASDIASELKDDNSFMTEVMERLDISGEDVAREMDNYDIASQLDLSDIASEIDLGDLAERVDIRELANKINTPETWEEVVREKVAVEVQTLARDAVRDMVRVQLETMLGVMIQSIQSK